jgi:hypothetical protein
MKLSLPFIVALSVVGTPAVAADELAWSIFEGESSGTLELGAGPPPDVTLVLRCRGEDISILQLSELGPTQISSGERSAFVFEAYSETEAVVAIDDPVWEAFLSGSPLRVGGAEYALSREENKAKAKSFFESCRGQPRRGSADDSES